MCGLVISVVLVVLFLGSMCSMFLGKLVSLNMCVIVMLLYMVVCGLGFSMIVLLSVSVGVIVCIVRYSGKLNGEIMLIMLCGWWCVSDRWLVVDGSILLVVCDGRLVVLCSVLMVMEVLKDVFVWVELFLCMSQLMIVLVCVLVMVVVWCRMVVCLLQGRVNYVGWVWWVVVDVLLMVVVLVMLMWLSVLLVVGLIMLVVCGFVCQFLLKILLCQMLVLNSVGVLLFICVFGEIWIGWIGVGWC